MIIAQETMENISSRSIANLLTGVAFASKEKILLLGFAPTGTVIEVNNIFSMF
jgi:hypothetical protein